jgi:hypothetical protein
MGVLMMRAYSLSHLSNQALLADLAALVAADRQTTAALLAHIAEVDARALYLPAACCRVAPARCRTGALPRSGLGDFHHPAPPSGASHGSYFHS